MYPARSTSLVVALGAMLSWPALVFGQSSWDDYSPRSFASIITQERSNVLKVFDDEPDRRIALTGNSFPSLGSIQYMDSMRATSPERLDLIRRWIESYHIDAKALGTFENEMLFREDTLDIWLPVQSQLVPYFENEFVEGDPVTLFIVWVGARGKREDIDWVFLVYGARSE